MRLSLADTATALGKSERQVRYLIQRGELPAQKVEGRWQIESDDLPLSVGQRHVLQQRVDLARQHIDAALEPTAKASSEAAGDEAKSERYSVRKLLAFDIGRTLYQELLAALGGEHSATGEVFAALVQLTQGCHAFQPEEKAEAFRRARRHAATATAHLLVANDECAEPLALRLEQELIPKIGGLVAAQEKARRRGSRFDRFGSGGRR